MLRFSNKGKEALGGLFLNLCALTYAGVFVESVFRKDGNTEYFVYGCVLLAAFCITGIVLIEKSNERRW